MIRIIDNKKIELSDDEWRMYNSICEGYDSQTFQGKSLFKNLFESDQNGIIINLIPPGNKYCSMEVLMFLLNVQQHQQLNIIHKKVDNFLKESKKILEETISKHKK